MTPSELVVALGQVWLLTGAGVGLAFLVFGLDRVDPAARGAYAFRPLLLPGLALLWPLALWRWSEAGAERPSIAGHAHRRRHGRIWLGLAVVIPLVLAASFVQRQHRLPETASQRLDGESQP